MPVPAEWGTGGIDRIDRERGEPTARGREVDPFTVATGSHLDDPGALNSRNARIVRVGKAGLRRGLLEPIVDWRAVVVPRSGQDVVLARRQVGKTERAEVVCCRPDGRAERHVAADGAFSDRIHRRVEQPVAVVVLNPTLDGAGPL